MRVRSLLSAILALSTLSCGASRTELRRSALRTTNAARDVALVQADGTRDTVLRHELGPYQVDDHERTFKHFQHLFVPGTNTLLTKGPGGLYSHHRGLFAGWSQTRCAGQHFDFWHGHDGARVEHLGFVDDGSCVVPGNVTRSTSTAMWRGGQGEDIVRETRQVTAWWQPGVRTLLDVELTLEACANPVELRGDPQHAGFQFRAAQEVADRRDETCYLRPPGANDTGNDVWENCAWAALLVPRTVGEGDAATERQLLVQHIDHPANPRPMVYSTRDYGRFGSYFEADLAVGEPLTLRYRIFVADLGVHPEETASEALEARAMEFAEYGIPAVRR